jgi:hypothetical protein
MKRTNALAIALAMALMATTAYAERSPIDDVQSPRAQDVQAPRDRPDEVQVPRGQEVQGPRDSTDEVQAPRGQ